MMLEMREREGWIIWAGRWNIRKRIFSNSRWGERRVRGQLDTRQQLSLYGLLLWNQRLAQCLSLLIVSMFSMDQILSAVTALLIGDSNVGVTRPSGGVKAPNSRYYDCDLSRDSQGWPTQTGSVLLVSHEATQHSTDRNLYKASYCLSVFKLSCWILKSTAGWAAAMFFLRIPLMH